MMFGSRLTAKAAPFHVKLTDIEGGKGMHNGGGSRDKRAKSNRERDKVRSERRMTHISSMMQRFYC